MTHQAIESDAEWVGVDFEFGNSHTPSPNPPPTPLPPRPAPPRPRPNPRHDVDAPERYPSTPGEDGVSVGVVGGAVGGVLGVVLLLLIVYMFVLRRRLSKAKSSGQMSSYQLRVEDVAHLSHLDETTNTYVNTTDLQKLVASVRARDKSSEGRLPTPPRLAHQQIPAPRLPPTAPLSGAVPQGDKVMLRAPMPLPHPPVAAETPSLPLAPQAVQEATYSNLQECPSKPRPVPRLEAPKVSPPLPPVKEAKPQVTQPARPAPDPPRSNTQPLQDSGVLSPIPDHQRTNLPFHDNDTNTTVQQDRPVPPPAAFKPGKIGASGAKPAPPTLPKPSKGKALPPLKIAMHNAGGMMTPDTTCPTPDTATTLLSPANTPVTEQSGTGVASISAKIAMLEGQMRTAGGPGGAPWLGGARP